VHWGGKDDKAGGGWPNIHRPKTLTGVTDAQTIKKSDVCLCLNAMSVLQWRYQFKLWTNILNNHISVFTSDVMDDIHPTMGCILITTYTMITYGGQRSNKSAKVTRAI
jgi:DNA excision repair protein ERCC-3